MPLNAIANNNDNATTLLRQVIPQMTSLSIPITPRNYAVWYEYFSGKNRELITAVNHYVNNDLTFTEEINNRLFQQFIEEQPTDALVKTHEVTEQIITALMQSITKAYSGNRHFGQVLTKYSEKMQAAASVESLNDMVTELLGHVNEVVTANATLQANLTEMREEVSSLKSEMSHLEQASLTDALTSLHNRRALESHMAMCLNNHKKHGVNFSMLVIDVDFFKKINDSHGHQVGDKVLSYIAKMLKSAVRGEDFVSRFGGEEFAVILANTDYKSALIVAESLCQRISAKALSVGKDRESIGHVTVSIGVSQADISDDNDACFARADQALYQAKHSGRNCVRGEMKAKKVSR